MTSPDNSAADSRLQQEVKGMTSWLREYVRDYDGLDHNAAAARLSAALLGVLDAKTLASVLANVVLEQVRAEAFTAAVGPVEVIADENHGLAADPRLQEEMRRMVRLGRVDGVVIDPQPGEQHKLWTRQYPTLDALTAAIESGEIPAGPALSPEEAAIVEPLGYSGHPGGPNPDPERAAALLPTAGVEVRLIGPEENCRAVMDQVRAAGVPLVAERGPRPSADRPDAVLFYTCTDEQTARNQRSRDRGGRRTRGGRTQP